MSVLHKCPKCGLTMEFPMVMSKMKCPACRVLLTVASGEFPKAEVAESAVVNPSKVESISDAGVAVVPLRQDVVRAEEVESQEKSCRLEMSLQEAYGKLEQLESQLEEKRRLFERVNAERKDYLEKCRRLEMSLEEEHRKLEQSESRTEEKRQALEKVLSEREAVERDCGLRILEAQKRQEEKSREGFLEALSRSCAAVRSAGVRLAISLMLLVLMFRCVFTDGDASAWGGGILASLEVLLSIWEFFLQRSWKKSLTSQWRAHVNQRD